jgi:PIN domain nuclease of toxin-antitoxin system
VKLLLDSHVVLWWQGADKRLGKAIVAAIAEAPEVYVSAATAWEIGLKVALGKLRIPEPIEDAVHEAGFRELPVTFEHTRAAIALPAHHKDPFDRMLIAQAQREGLTIVTHDEAILRYDVAILRVP